MADLLHLNPIYHQLFGHQRIQQHLQRKLLFYFQIQIPKTFFVNFSLTTQHTILQGKLRTHTKKQQQKNNICSRLSHRQNTQEICTISIVEQLRSRLFEG